MGRHPRRLVVSALHGWDDGFDSLHAPQGTADARRASMPRRAGQAGKATAQVSLAALTAGPVPLQAQTVTELAVGIDRLRLTWALGQARSVIRLGPAAVCLLE
ncbi:hypothetical protein RFN58_42110 [Streptomyces iakyrus]|uniref:hypothetical protein n=1 Tax=Streptomyces iakyrus TaxID=68219 RepID=UPI00068C7B53|nr:hypothetical protein [Streptomyces iakyrus]